MNKATTIDIDLGQGKVLSLETGRLARQAGGAVIARLGDTMVLCTAVVADKAREGQDFFPLSVDYREKFSAAGKFPGGFIKREGRPSDKEVLSSRLVDRAIRPLFPSGFFNEIQIMLTVISADGENDADVIAGVGASAALMLTGAPFSGPIGEVRVGRIEGEWVLNPTVSELPESDFDLIVAGTDDAIVMIEGEMKEVSEDEMLEAFDFAHEAIRRICSGQKEFFEQAGGIEPMEYETVTVPDELVARVRELAYERVAAQIRQPYDKRTFSEGIREAREAAMEALLGIDDPEAGIERALATAEGYTGTHIAQAFGKVEKAAMRDMILSDQRRLDGRGLTDIREIWCEVGYLPRVHGSALFTRGETQALASITLGTGKDAQDVDQIFDVESKHFYLQYNFPPFCTGEIKRFLGVGRREVGHGFLAERALAQVLPSIDDFPYTIRVVSDVLESNGSSSMASVCAGSLALMHAGVPIRKPVSGIAMGLIKEGDRTAVLSDILGAEDHLGDMDFKVTGTRDGITACQMDIKIKGLSRSVMKTALEQAHAGRDHILDIMMDTISEPRPDLSPYAPRLTQLVIDSDFIGAVIGPGGKVIQGLQRETNTKIEIEEREGKGFVTIAAVNEEDARTAIDRIRMIVAVPEPGQNYVGTVRSVQPFGAIIEIMPGKEGLLHVSEIAYGYVEKAEDHFQVGDKVEVQLIEVRDDGKLRLSRKPFLEKPEGYEEPAPREHSGGERRGRDGGGYRGGRDGGQRGGGNRGGRR